MDDDRLLIDQKDLAHKLDMSAKAAREFCHQNGVEPINTAKGKKRATLRWSLPQVIRMLDTMCAEGKPQRRPSTKKTVVGKSMQQIIAELPYLVQ